MACQRIVLCAAVPPEKNIARLEQKQERNQASDDDGDGNSNNHNVLKQYCTEYNNKT